MLKAKPRLGWGFWGLIFHNRIGNICLVGYGSDENNHYYFVFGFDEKKIIDTMERVINKKEGFY